MRLARTVFAFVLFFAFSPSQAQSDPENNDSAWQLLRSGEAVAVMRHALAPGGGDPVSFTLGDCSTQRNLSDEGRDQARAAGDLLRSRGIDNARVLTSQWCRCEETAQLMEVGAVAPAPMLNSFFQDRSTAKEQTQQLLEAVRGWTESRDGTTVLVTHQVNISALTGEFAASGEILIVTMRDDSVQVLLRVPT